MDPDSCTADGSLLPGPITVCVLLRQLYFSHIRGISWGMACEAMVSIGVVMLQKQLIS